MLDALEELDDVRSITTNLEAEDSLLEYAFSGRESLPRTSFPLKP
jgi:hypothetical protein